MTSLNQTTLVTPALLSCAVFVVACCAAVEVSEEYGESTTPPLLQPLMMFSSRFADGVVVAVFGYVTANLRGVRLSVASPANRAGLLARRWQIQRPVMSA